MALLHLNAFSFLEVLLHTSLLVVDQVEIALLSHDIDTVRCQEATQNIFERGGKNGYPDRFT